MSPPPPVRRRQRAVTLNQRSYHQPKLPSIPSSKVLSNFDRNVPVLPPKRPTKSIKRFKGKDFLDINDSDEEPDLSTNVNYNFCQFGSGIENWYDYTIDTSRIKQISTHHEGIDDILKDLPRTSAGTFGITLGLALIKSSASRDSLNSSFLAIDDDD